MSVETLQPERAAADESISVTQSQAAKLLGISARTIRRWEARGILSGECPGGGVKLYPVARLKQLAGAAGFVPQAPKRVDQWPR